MSERNVALTFSEEVLSRGLAVMRMLIVARILAPEEIGRFALTVAFLAAFELTTNPGLADAVIHARDDDSSRDEVVWTALVLRGVAIAGLLWTLSPLLAALVARPDIVDLLRLIAVAPVLQGLRSVSVILTQREVRFGRLTAVRLLTSSTETGAAIVLAILWETASALVAGVLIGQAVFLALSYSISGFRPKLSFRFRRLKTLLAYARWRFASGIAFYVATTADDLALGRFAGATHVGHYRVAYQIANVPATSLTSAIGSVAFPALSRLERQRPGELLAVLPRYLRLVSGIAGFVAAGIAVTGTSLIRGLLGDVWLPAVPALVVLCAAGFGRSIAATGGIVFLGLGQPRLDARMQWTRAVVLLPALALIFPFGLVGAAVASLLSISASLIMWHVGLRSVGAETRRLYNDLAMRLPALAGGCALSLAAQAMADRPLPELALGSLGYGLGWLLTTSTLDRRLLEDLAYSLRRLVQVPLPRG